MFFFYFDLMTRKPYFFLFIYEFSYLLIFFSLSKIYFVVINLKY